jgi:Flp pilus assembly protein TadG
MNIRFVQPRGGHRRNESGQALVEFALVVPIFLLLLLGVVEFARAWNLYEVLTDAGREGARRAVVDNPTTTEADVVAAIQAAGSRVGISIPSTGIQITGFHSGRGNQATVRIEYDHELKWVGALMGLLTGERTLTMVSEFAMRNE